MAALLSQGERAKVNFADSMSLFCVHTGLDPGPICSAHVSTQISSLSDVAPSTSVADAAPTATMSEDSLKLHALGATLDELANKLPYSAVHNGSQSTTDWEEFYHKNETLQQVSDIIQQLIWFSSQVLKGALADGWESRHSEWEEACKKIESAEEAVALVREFEKNALNWDEINALWEAQEAEESKALLATESQCDADKPDGTAAALAPDLSMKVDPGDAWQLQKRKFAEGPGQGPEDIEASITHFMELNQHLIEDIDHPAPSKEAATKASPAGRLGIVASLEAARASRAARRRRARPCRRSCARAASRTRACRRRRCATCRSPGPPPRWRRGPFRPRSRSRRCSSSSPRSRRGTVRPG